MQYTKMHTIRFVRLVNIMILSIIQITWYCSSCNFISVFNYEYD